ncbi:MAG TPA: DUF2330 domain-containing protein [Thermoanaerobaculia bacterium]|nr:DUF2330 domain-containing protein [Thermoanaerobaculia bacterium]
MRKFPWLLSLCLVTLSVPAHSFCGFYVAKADTRLYNKASQVAIVRSEQHTILTMSNDYKGDPKEFAIVVPVPTFIQRGQIHVSKKELLDHLDAYSSPRLVEYFDPDPCQRWEEKDSCPMCAMDAAAPATNIARKKETSLGVTVEARYTVGEYDIVILSAKQSSGLETWLRQSGYRIPPGASATLASYIKQNVHFFVARVNLKEQTKLGFNYLRPLQIAFDSPKFMLPIRLGMVNANGPQELFIYMISRKGRVESTNYQTTKLPTGMDVPVYVKNDFGPFYKALFSEQVRKSNMNVVFTEYAWDMRSCDPCASEPLSGGELKELGVFWQNGSDNGGVQDVFLTRLHVRYDNAHFPEDLVFQETSDLESFQARYVIRHPWTGSEGCDAAAAYRRDLIKRQGDEARTLASLTGWKVPEIRKRMNIPANTNVDGERHWWESIWQ